jgi:hypothetical protein
MLKAARGANARQAVNWSGRSALLDAVSAKRQDGKSHDF